MALGSIISALFSSFLPLLIQLLFSIFTGGVA
jgi:hypothetical protein